MSAPRGLGGLALRSVQHRVPAFIATFAAIALGSALMGTFATLAAAGTGDVSAQDRETLIIMGAVVGGWGALIVLFSVASTMGIAVRQRAPEITLLRAAGATPSQVRRLVRREALAVGALAAVLGVAIAAVAGPALLALLRAAGMVDGGVRPRAAVAAAAVAAAVVVAASLAGATVAGAAAARGSTASAVTGSRAERRRIPRWRGVIGVVFVGYGIAMAIITVTVTRHDPDPYAAMSTSGSSSVLVGVGLGVLSPVLVRGGAIVVRPLLSRAGAAGSLAAFTASRRAGMMAGVLAPVIVLTSSTIGTLMLVGIDARTIPAGLPEGDTITLLNNVITAMIAVFCAIMVVNAFAAVVADRRGEFARLRLLGATPDQVRGSVLAEAGLVAALGVVLGAVASLATVIPFAVARGEGLLPDGQLWLPPAVAAGAAALAIAAAGRAARRAVQASALTAAA